MHNLREVNTHEDTSSSTSLVSFTDGDPALSLKSAWFATYCLKYGLDSFILLGFAVYGGAKAWVNIFTKAAADEGKPHGIRVFAVAPGAVETRMLRDCFPDFPSADTLAPDDVARLVEACWGSALASCSGQTLFIRR